MCSEGGSMLTGLALLGAAGEESHNTCFGAGVLRFLLGIDGLLKPADQIKRRQS